MEDLQEPVPREVQEDAGCPVSTATPQAECHCRALNDWVLSPKPSSLRDQQLCSVPFPTLVYFSVSEILEPGDHRLHPQKLGAEINLSCFKSSFSAFVTTMEKMINFISDFGFPLQTSGPILGPSREAVHILQSPKTAGMSSSFPTHPEPSFSHAEACPLLVWPRPCHMQGMEAGSRSSSESIGSPVCPPSGWSLMAPHSFHTNRCLPSLPGSAFLLT